MKKGIVFLFAIILVFTVTACDKKESDRVSESDQIHITCNRTGTIDENSGAKMTYEVYYTGDIINYIESTEVVTSTSSSVLDTYEAAYKKIHDYYTDIDHYETELIRTTTTVTSKMYIDYDKINIKELVELEGEEDNIFEDNLPKMSKYREFAKKIGITCEDAS